MQDALQPSRMVCYLSDFHRNGNYHLRQRTVSEGNDQFEGRGLTAGKSSLKGTGTFSGVSNISELYRAYAKAEAHAGVVKSAGAQVLTKGEVFLSLAGTGKGVDLGIYFGKFTIKPAGTMKGKK